MIINQFINFIVDHHKNLADLCYDPYTSQISQMIADDSDQTQSILIDPATECPLTISPLEQAIVRFNCNRDPVQNGDYTKGHYYNYNKEGFLHPTFDKSQCPTCRTFIEPDMVTLLMRNTVDAQQLEIDSKETKEQEEKSNEKKGIYYRPCKILAKIKPELHKIVEESPRFVATCSAAAWAWWGLITAISTISKHAFTALRWTLTLTVGPATAIAGIGLFVSTSPIALANILLQNDLEAQHRIFKKWHNAIWVAAGMIGIVVTFSAILYVGGFVLATMQGVSFATLPLSVILDYMGQAFASIIGWGVCLLITQKWVPHPVKPLLTPFNILEKKITHQRFVPFCEYRDTQGKEASEKMLATRAEALAIPEEERPSLSYNERSRHGFNTDGSYNHTAADRKVINENIKWALPSIPDVTSGT